MLNANDLKSRVDLRDIVRSLWGDPKHSSPRYNVYEARWRPDGRKASFTVYETHYKDYGGSGDSGDVFAFLQEELSIDFKGALEWVHRYLGGASIEPEQPRRAPQPQQKQTHTPSSSKWQAAAQAALKRAQDYLWSDQPDAQLALDYLRTVRGFSDETIKRAGYGYNPRWQSVGEGGKLAPGIIEPWWCDGVLWALRVRCRVGNLAQALDIPEDTFNGNPSPKYLNLTGSKQAGALYNGDSITPGCDVLLVEGGFDARLAEQELGGSVAVVTFGSATNHPTTQRLEQLGQAEHVFLLLDKDEAGQAAQDKLLAALGEKAVPITLPDGKDVTDFVTGGGDLPALMQEARQRAASWWPNGVPDDWRSMLLRYFRPVTAPVIELINTAVCAGLLDAQAFTVNDVLRANDELGFFISDGSIRRVVAELEAYFFAKLDTEKTPNNAAYNSEKNSRGRRAHTYRLLPLQVIRDTVLLWAIPRIVEKLHPNLPDDDATLAEPTPLMFESVGFSPAEAESIAAELRRNYAEIYDNPRIKRALSRKLGDLRHATHSILSTPLPEGWSVANGTDYRAAFLRATNDEEKRRSRREIREKIGVSNGSVTKMVRRAGLKPKEEGGEFEDVVLQSAENVEQQVKEAGWQVAGYPRAVVVNHPDGQEETAIYRGDQSHEAIQSHIEAGADVSVRFQVANHYIELNVIPPEKPKQEKPRREAAPRRPRKPKFFGPGHDPNWVVGQLALLLVEHGRLRYLPDDDSYLNTQTGEVYASLEVSLLLALL